jgi:Fe2+ or Zn2+ uptake regulation protein
MTDADRLRETGPRETGPRETGPRRAIRGAVRAGGHPIVCRGCGTVAQAGHVVGHGPCLAPATGAGFAIDETEVTFRGLCPRCRTTGTGQGPPQR